MIRANQSLALYKHVAFLVVPVLEAIDGIPFRLMDYIELVDWTARQYRDNKASMGIHMPPILHV